MPTLSEALEAVDWVFEGRVINTWPIRIQHRGTTGITTRQTFRVVRNWKGEGTPEFQLVQDLSNCSFPFRHGESYLVFAYSDPELPYATTSICTRTALAEAIPFDQYQALGPGQTISKSDPYVVESLLHLTARRTKVALLLLSEWWRSQDPTPRDVVARFLLQMSAAVLLVTAGVLLWRGRWRSSVLVLSLSLALGWASLLRWSYAVVAQEPWLTYLVE